MANPPENKNGMEVAKMYFEYFKHFTTLSATAALGVAALRDIASIERVSLYASIASFVLSLVISMLGTFYILGKAGGRGTLPNSGLPPQLLLAFAVMMSFLHGVVQFTVGATTPLQIPGWLWWLGLAIAVTLVLYLLFRMIRMIRNDSSNSGDSEGGTT